MIIDTLSPAYMQSLVGQLRKQSTDILEDRRLTVKEQSNLGAIQIVLTKTEAVKENPILLIHYEDGETDQVFHALIHADGKFGIDSATDLGASVVCSITSFCNSLSEDTVKTKSNKSKLDDLIAQRMKEIDWILNVGIGAEDEKVVCDLEKSIQMIGRILFKTEHTVVFGNLWNFLEDEILEELTTIADRHGVDLADIPDHPYVRPWTPTEHFQHKTDDKW